MDEIEDIQTGAIVNPNPDWRDIPYAMVASAAPLPETYKTNIDALDVLHQRKIGACVGHAFAKYLQYAHYRRTGEVVKFSARYLYAMAKSMDNHAGEGTFPELVAKIAKNYGCATEETCPNDTTLDHEAYVYNRNKDNIPAEAHAEAIKYKIGGYAFVNFRNIWEVKQAIYENGMVACLLRVGKEWYTDKNGKKSWDKDDILPLRKPESIISGHEVVLYGYDDKNLYQLANSWSTKWADKGNGNLLDKEYNPYLIQGIIIKDLPPAIIEDLHNLPVDAPRHTFNQNLEYGMRNNSEVKHLQDILKYEKLMDLNVPSTGNYLEITQKAVLAYQKKYKLINLYQELAYKGKYCYATTRAHLNSKYGM